MVALASFGGTKFKETTNYKNKIQYFKKISQNFAKSNNGYYLPDWEHEEMWKNQHIRYLNSAYIPEEKERLTKQFPTPKSFRDYCYEKAEKANYDECDGTDIWCIECGKEF